MTELYVLLQFEQNDTPKSNNKYTNFNRAPQKLSQSQELWVDRLHSDRKSSESEVPFIPFYSFSPLKQYAAQTLQKYCHTCIGSSGQALLLEDSGGSNKHLATFLKSPSNIVKHNITPMGLAGLLSFKFSLSNA